MLVSFKKNVEILGKKVCSGILDILNSGFILHNLNLTHIALTPKANNLECVTKFRPISLQCTIQIGL